MITKAFAETDWHLNKTVTVSIIGVLIGMAGSMITIYVTVREDIATIKAQMVEARAADQRQERAIEESMRQTREDIRLLRAELSAEIKALTAAVVQRR